ncbi:MAG: hypothetical protein IPF98_15370 [Gemmatimonadetes bacterium]|nr:hypothetical protein [Gemmatimonadota bacterium]MCC6770133.1 hypothetical protein [Gemmatimonadaceae bacterium]
MPDILSVRPNLRGRFLGATLLFLLVAGAPLQAQARPARTLVSVNPLGLPFKYVSAELEQKTNTFATVGLSASFINIGDGSYASLEGKLRLYPNEEAFQGFSIGLGAGLTRVSEDVYNGNTQSDENRSNTSPTIAVIADYNWMLGKTKRVVVGTGVGAKRIFGDSDGFSDVNFAYPTARFQVGVVF